MRQLIVAATVVLSVVTGVAQQAPSSTPSESSHQPLQLSITEIKLITSEPVGALLSPTRCDSEGNIYYRKLDEAPPYREPIKEVAPNGEVKATFSFASDSSFAADVRGMDFFVTTDGDLYQILTTSKGNEATVITFGHNGSVRSKARLDTPFRPSFLGVFPSGEFLAAGLAADMPTKADSNAPQVRMPFTAVFRPDGTLVKKIEFDDDQRILQAISIRDESTVPAGQNREAAFTAGGVIDGADGNLYLWRRTSPLTLFAVSPTGQIVKTISIRGRANTTLPARVFPYKGMLAVLYKNAGPGDAYIAVVELKTGEIVNEYIPDAAFASSLTCYMEPSFFFLAGKNDKLAVYRAEPR